MTVSAGARLKGFLYRPIYWYREHYEEYEAWVISFELSLIGTGLWAVWSELRDEKIRDLTYSDFIVHHFKDALELGIFVTLLMSGISRLVVAARGSSLGYAYGQITRMIDPRGDNDVADMLYAKVKAAPWDRGEALGVGHKPGYLLPFAKAIAARTASLLSVRSFHYLDKRWMKREQDSLGEWFETFPASLWRLSPRDRTKDESSEDRHNRSGYFSVIVPVTRTSWRSIRLGQKATDLAEVDRNVAEYLARKGSKRSRLGRVELLAYLQVHVPSRNEDATAEDLLFAASIQHLAYLLNGLYGSDDAFRKSWNFSIVCEAANRQHGRVLEKLGFDQLRQKAHERSDTPVRPGRSYAGFPLWELQVQNGEAAEDLDREGRRADAQKFIYFLEDRVAEYAKWQASHDSASRQK